MAQSPSHRINAQRGVRAPQNQETCEAPGDAREDELLCFNLDRSIVARQVRKLWRSLAAGASDLELVAAEGVFDPGVSAALAQQARALKAMAQELKTLHSAVARARFPGGEQNGNRRCLS